MKQTDFYVMNKDVVVAEYSNRTLVMTDEELCPLAFRYCMDFESWLSSRAIDAHRTNSRLLKRAMRLKETDDITTALSVHAATITDTYWVKEQDSERTYQDVLFRVNDFDRLALYGDPASFANKPSHTPELTNIGSYEKCWRLIDGEWWMYKSGTVHELFSEMAAYKIALALGFPIAEYQMDKENIRSKDITNAGQVNLEPFSGIVGDTADYLVIYDKLQRLCPTAAKQYAMQCYLDAVVYNMDRHNGNSSLLRVPSTGAILGMAPFYDHNLSLIARGYPSKNTNHDVLMTDCMELFEQRDIALAVKKISKEELCSSLQDLNTLFADPDEFQQAATFVVDFVTARQQLLNEKIFGKCIEHETENDFEI